MGGMVTPWDIPSEIILEEIVCRLPVKSVLRLRSVCQTWLGLIDSERFTEKHLQLSAKERGSESAIVMDFEGYEMRQCSLQSVLQKTVAADAHRISFRWWFRRSRTTAGVVGCCNGLVCVFSTEGACYLWNPSTRVAKELPRECVDGRTPEEFDLAGFGWDASSGAYKVFAPLSPRRVSCYARVQRNYMSFYDPDVHSSSAGVCKVYSTKTNSWRVVEERRGFHGINRGGQFVGGKLHWQRFVAGAGGDIVTLDVQSEEFGVMEQPCTGFWSLGVLGDESAQQQLCVGSCSPHDEDAIDVWVFNHQSWIKLIAAVPAIHHTFPFPAPCNAPHLIFITYRSGTGLSVYDPKRNQIVYVPHAHRCLQTLVSF